MTIPQNDISLQALEYEQLKRRARTNLLDFAMFVKEDYVPNWHHEIFAQILDDVIFGDTKRLMSFMPAQHGKSELSTRMTTALLLGINPDLRIAIVAYNSPFAQKFNREIQRIIDSPRYKELFPNTRLNGNNSRTTGNWLRNSDTCEIVGHKGSFKTVGINGALTGDPVDILIVDDPYKNRQAANSAANRRMVNDFWDDVADKRLDNNSKVLITYTRWREDDLAGRELNFIKEGKVSYEYVVAKFQALKDEDYDLYEDPREEGEALWESKHSRRRHLDAKAKNPSSFEAMGQQNPTAKEGNIIKRYWFNPYHRGDIPPDVKAHMYIDTAQSEAELKGNDPTGILVYKWHNNNLYLVDFIKGMWGITEQCNQIAAMAEKYNIDRTCEIAIENKDNAKSVKNLLSKGTGFSIVLDNPVGGKLERVENEEPFFESGRCFAPKEDMWFADFLHQCLGFDNLAHDEEVDCLTGAIRRGSRKAKRGKYGIANLKR